MFESEIKKYKDRINILKDNDKIFKELKKKYPDLTVYNGGVDYIRFISPSLKEGSFISFANYSIPILKFVFRKKEDVFGKKVNVYSLLPRIYANRSFNTIDYEYTYSKDYVTVKINDFSHFKDEAFNKANKKVNDYLLYLVKDFKRYKLKLDPESYNYEKYENFFIFS